MTKPRKHNMLLKNLGGFRSLRWLLPALLLAIVMITYAIVDPIDWFKSAEITGTITPTIEEHPIAAFTYSPAFPLLGETVTFNASESYDPDGAIVSYAWDFDDGNITTVTDPVITHAYTEADTYTVTLTVTDDDGLTDTATADVTVFPPVPATIESCDLTGEKKDIFDLEETVFANGTGYAPSMTYDIYVVDDVTWSDGMSIPVRVPHTVATVSSDSLGNIPPTAVWSGPLTCGKFDIVVDVNGNGKYDEHIDALDDMDKIWQDSS